MPKQLYEICDFPHTKVASGHFPRGAEVQTYLEDFADKNDLNKMVCLNSTVERAERKTDGTGGIYCIDGSGC